jgi:hypothetical protein
MAKAPTRAATFADQVDRLVHTELNYDEPMAHRFGPEVVELATAFIEIYRLLDLHQKKLGPRLGASRRFLDELRTGARGPIWRYIDDVKKTRRRGRKMPAGSAAYAIHAAIFSLIDAYGLLTGIPTTQAFEKVSEKLPKELELSIHRVKRWRKQFANLADQDPNRQMLEIFRRELGKYTSAEELLVHGCHRVLLIRGNMTAGQPEY